MSSSSGGSGHCDAYTEYSAECCFQGLELTLSYIYQSTYHEWLIGWTSGFSVKERKNMFVNTSILLVSFIRFAAFYSHGPKHGSPIESQKPAGYPSTFIWYKWETHGPSPAR